MKNELKSHTPAASVRNAGETQVITTAAGPPIRPPRKNIEGNFFFLRGLPYENIRLYRMKWWIIRICTFLDFVRSILDPEGRDKDMLSFQMRAKAQEWENRAATTKKATVRIAPPPEQAVRIIGKVEIESGWHDKWHPAMSSMTEAQIAEFLNKAGLIPQSRTHRIAPRQNPDAGTNRVLAAWG